jgi:hypothetical protein
LSDIAHGNLVFINSGDILGNVLRNVVGERHTRNDQILPLKNMRILFSKSAGRIFTGLW